MLENKILQRKMTSKFIAIFVMCFLGFLSVSPQANARPVQGVGVSAGSVSNTTASTKKTSSYSNNTTASTKKTSSYSNRATPSTKKTPSSNSRGSRYSGKNRYSSNSKNVASRGYTNTKKTRSVNSRKNKTTGYVSRGFSPYSRDSKTVDRLSELGLSPTQIQMVRQYQELGIMSLSIADIQNLTGNNRVAAEIARGIATGRAVSVENGNIIVGVCSNGLGGNFQFSPPPVPDTGVPTPTVFTPWVPKYPDSGDPGVTNPGDPGIPPSSSVDFTTPGSSGSTSISSDTQDPSLVSPLITADGSSEAFILKRRGDIVNVQWDPRGGVGCRLSNQLVGNPNQKGVDSVTLSSETIFSITCSNGSDSIRVKVLPMIYES